MAYKNYKMRIANRGQLSKNKTYAFSMENVNNIPVMSIFIEDAVNEKIAEGCKNVLMRSMNSKNRYRYGEQGLLISTLDNSVHIEFQGNYSNVSVNNRYKQELKNRHQGDLIFIHNHPNNSTFSIADLRHLSNDINLKGIVAVGNRHNIFVVLKEGNCNKLQDFIENCLIKCAAKNGVTIRELTKDMIGNLEIQMVRYILSYQRHFNISYIVFKRRNKNV